jgi:DNA replication and repair protein RecF
VIILRIRIENFRNISRAAIGFADRYNLVRGRNSQGKTNLVEAVHFFSLGRSFRTRRSDDVLKFGEEYMYMKLEGVRDGGVGVIGEIAKERGGRVRVKVDGERLPVLSDIIGLVPTVLFVPEDVEIISGSPALRRRYVDYTAAQAYSGFLEKLKEYRRALRQKNEELKRVGRGGEKVGVLDSLNSVMVSRGAEIVKDRGAIIREISVEVNRLYGEVVAGGKVEMDYWCSYGGGSEEGREAFERRLGSVFEEEVDRGYAVVGPHRDEIIFLEGGRSIRKYGSQGRKRLLALLLKMSQAEVISKVRGERPVLLMDDVYSELDERVEEKVRDLLKGDYQTLATTPREEGGIGKSEGGEIFEVEDGNIVKRD